MGSDGPTVILVDMSSTSQHLKQQGLAVQL
eukprot:COSAG01_NODE_231_length_21019_cov_104.980501_22_plen_30_part_00